MEPRYFVREGVFYLRSAIKTLTAQTKSLHSERRRAWKMRNLEHRQHVICTLDYMRRNSTRLEARATLLAYGFLRGKSYAQIEPFARAEPHWAYVEQIVQRFAPRNFSHGSIQANAEAVRVQFRSWVAQAKGYLKETGGGHHKPRYKAVTNA